MKSLTFIRRLHMYLGIALVPWFLCYGISAAIFNHGQLVSGWFKSDKPEWTKVFEREYHCSLSADADPRAIGADPSGCRHGGSILLRVVGERQQAAPEYQRLYVPGEDSPDVLRGPGRIVAEDQAVRLDHFLVGVHERAGFRQSPWMTKAWGVVVDVVGLAVMTWTISGLYVWWKTHRRHVGGGLVLAAGIICFVALVAYL